MSACYRVPGRAMRAAIPRVVIARSLGVNGRVVSGRRRLSATAVTQSGEPPRRVRMVIKPASQAPDGGQASTAKVQQDYELSSEGMKEFANGPMVVMNDSINKETGEIGGYKGPEPTRHKLGEDSPDWDIKGRCSDF